MDIKDIEVKIILKMSVSGFLFFAVDKTPVEVGINPAACSDPQECFFRYYQSMTRI